MKIVVVGSGYVGLVTGTCLAEYGHDVTCVDTNQEKIEMLLNGKSPIYEPGLDDLLEKNIHDGRLNFTTDLNSCLEGAEAAFIAVGTPEGEDGSADLKYVRAVAEAIGAGMTDNLLVIVKSTVPVGTCDMVEGILTEKLAELKVGFRATVASNPEFLKEGDAIDDFMKPDRIVCGLNGTEGEKTLLGIYKPFIIDDPNRLMIFDRRSSELTKYGSNAMLATRISFMNEMSRLADKIGANMDHIRRGMGADSRIGKKFLYAGPGYGGSCFPKDVAALLKTGEKFGVQLSVLQSVSDTNWKQKEYAANCVISAYPDLKGKRLAVWGLAFKPGTDDVREAPAKTIIEKLLDAGAKVIAHDPEATDNFKKEMHSEHLQYADDAYSALDGADGLILVTEWGEYRRPDWKRIKKNLRELKIFDLRNQYDFDALAAEGFEYYCIGRPDSRTKSVK